MHPRCLRPVLLRCGHNQVTNVRAALGGTFQPMNPKARPHHDLFVLGLATVEPVDIDFVSLDMQRDISGPPSMWAGS